MISIKYVYIYICICLPEVASKIKVVCHGLLIVSWNLNLLDC